MTVEQNTTLETPEIAPQAAPEPQQAPETPLSEDDMLAQAFDAVTAENEPAEEPAAAAEAEPAETNAAAPSVRP